MFSHRSSFCDRAKETSKSGSPPATLHFNQEINSLSKQKLYDQACAAFEKMQACKIPPDVITYNTMINVYVKCQKLTLAYQLFEQMKHNNVLPTIVTYTSLIDGCGKCGNFAQALVIFNEVKKTTLPLNMHFFNALLNAGLLNGEAGVIDMVLKEIKKRNLKPNTVTYNTILAGYIRFNQIEKMKEVVEEMVAMKIELSSVTQMTILQAAQLVHNQNELNNLFDLIKKAKFTPTKVQATQTVQELIFLKRLIIAQQLLNAFITMNIPFSCDAYISLLSLAGEYSNFQVIKWAIETANSHGFVINEYAFDAQINAYIGLGNLDIALEMFHQCKKNHHKIPINIVYELLRCLLQNFEFEKAIALVQDAIDDDIIDTQYADKIMIELFWSEQYESILQFYPEFKCSIGVEGSNCILNSAIHLHKLNTIINKIHCMRPNLEVFLELIRRLSSEQVNELPIQEMIEPISTPPSTSLLRDLIAVFLRKKSESNGWFFFTHFVQLGTEPTIELIELAIKTLTVSSSFENFHLIYQIAQDNYLDITPELYIAIIRSALKSGDVGSVMQLYSEMNDQNMKIPNDISIEVSYVNGQFKYLYPDQQYIAPLKPTNRYRTISFVNRNVIDTEPYDSDIKQFVDDIDLELYF